MEVNSTDKISTTPVSPGKSNKNGGEMECVGPEYHTQTKMEPFDAFTSHLRRYFSKWVDDSLVCELEDAWKKRNFDKAYSVFRVMCHRIPDRAKTPQFYDGIELGRMKSQFNKQPRLRTKEHVVRTETLERIYRPEQHIQSTALSFYFSVLISGMKDENLPYLQSVLDMDTSVPHHRDLKDIALFANNLFTRIYQFETKLKDVRVCYKKMANDTQQRDEGFEPFFKESDSVSRISQLLSDVELDIDVIVANANSLELEIENRKRKEIKMLFKAIALKSKNDILVQNAICNETLLKEKEQFQNMIQDLQDRLSILKGQNEAKDMQLKKAAKKLLERESKYDDMLSKQHENDTQQSQYLEYGMKQLYKEKEEMRNRKDNERRRTRELEDTLKRIERERGLIKERLESDKQHFEAKVKQLQRKHEELVNRQEHYNVEELEGRIRQLEMEKQELSNSLTETQQYTKTIELLEAQLASVEIENRQLLKRLTENQEYAKTIEQLEAKLTSIENEKSQIQNGQHHERIKAKELEEKVRQLEWEKQEIVTKRSAETQQNAKTIKQLEANLATVENEKCQLQNGQKCERNKMKELEDRVRKHETEKEEIFKRNDTLKNQLDAREGEVHNLKQEMEKIKDEKDDLQNRNGTLENQLDARAGEVHNLKQEMEKIKDEKDDLQNRNGTLENQLDAREGEVHNLKQEMEKIKDEKDDLQNRFNEVAAIQQPHENPVIADLSDKYRPTKLGEMYSELYDNEWTEAFSVIQDDTSTASEEGIVNRLREILLNCYMHCVDTSKNQLDSLCAVLVSPNAHKEQKVIPHELINDSSMFVIELRKQTCSSAIESIKKEMTTKYADSIRYPALKAYLEKCAELCWLMVIQSPAVYIDGRQKSGDRFDRDFFKAYTRQGSVIDFVVWPPVYLHQGGPMLCKGTAQGRE